MKKLTGLGSALDMAIEINKSIGLSSAIMGIAQTQNELNRKLMPYQGMLDLIIKSSRTMNAYKPELNGILGIAQAIQKNAMFGMPSQTMSAIELIANQHRSLFASTNAITAAMSSTIGMSQLNSLQVALNSVSGNIARIAASTNNWDIIDDFESVSEQAVELSENLAGDFQFSEETSRAFDKLVNLVVAFIKKNKQTGIYYLLFIDMVLRVASLHQYYDFLKTKPEIATKEDVKRLETKLLQSIEKKLKDEKEYRTTTLRCKVFLKPKTKSLVLANLPKKSDVIVLQMKQKWVYVSFVDPKDNYSQTGWMLKKYLARPKE